jgi:PHD/YefM family antitoxin component YafN of YafNO toxin-antitoxin module
MTTVTLENAATNLATIASRAIRDAEETVVATDEGAIVLIDQREWERTQETLRLLSDKRSLAALLEGHALRDQGKRPGGTNALEAFSDLQD